MALRTFDPQSLATFDDLGASGKRSRNVISGWIAISDEKWGRATSSRVRIGAYDFLAHNFSIRSATGAGSPGATAYPIANSSMREAIKFPRVAI